MKYHIVSIIAVLLIVSTACNKEEPCQRGKQFVELLSSEKYADAETMTTQKSAVAFDFFESTDLELNFKKGQCEKTQDIPEFHYQLNEQDFSFSFEEGSEAWLIDFDFPLEDFIKQTFITNINNDNFAEATKITDSLTASLVEYYVQEGRTFETKNEEVKIVTEDGHYKVQQVLMPPDFVGYQFLHYLNKSDYDNARKLSTEQGKQILTMFENLAAMAEGNPDEAELVMGNCKIDEDTATLHYTSNGTAEQIQLFKQPDDGQWLVNLTKEN